MLLVKLIDAWMNKNYFKKLPEAEYSYLELSSYIFNAEDINAGKSANLLQSMFDYLQNAVILTFIKKTAFGIEWINGYIKSKYFMKFDSSGSHDFFSGMPVIILQNSYEMELFNGDTGIIIKTGKNDYSAVFQKSGKFNLYKLSLLPVYYPAFAITTHKSQGSEFNKILCILPDKKDK